MLRPVVVQHGDDVLDRMVPGLDALDLAPHAVRHHDAVLHDDRLLHGPQDVAGLDDIAGSWRCKRRFRVRIRSTDSTP